MNVNKKFSGNVKNICRLNNTKIGDLERAVGVRLGYFARHAEKGYGLSLDIAYKVSAYFGIPINELIEGNYESALLKLEIKKVEQRLRALQEEEQRLKRCKYE